MEYRFRIAIFFIALLFFSSCKKDWNDLGSQFVVQDELILLSYDNQPLEFSLIKEDSLSTLNRPTFFLGSMTEPIYGQSEASIYTELSLSSSNVDFGPSAEPDSIVLRLSYEGYYGDTLSTLTIRVMEMLETIETSTLNSSGEDTTHSVYSFEQFNFDPLPLGEIDFTHPPSSSNEIRIPLSIDLAQRFLDTDIENLIDNEAFQSFFNGLHVACDPVSSGGVLLELSASENSKLTLYYHTSELDSLTYDFNIDNNADKMTHWYHDYSAEIESLFEVENISYSYVQGGVGLRTYIDLPDLSSLQDSNFVIHKAELILPYVSSEIDTIYTLPESLGLAAVNAEGNLEILNEDQNVQGLSYFNGAKNETDKTYSFNIARYIEKVIAEDYSSQLALYIPSSISQPYRVKLNNQFVGDFDGAKLKMFVSKY